MITEEVRPTGLSPRSIRHSMKGSAMRSILSGLACYVLVTTSCLADKVLILGSTVTGGLSGREAQAAAALGYTVDVVSPTIWASIPATGPNGFSSYRAIILGDPECGFGSDISAAEANRTIWGPEVNGNIIIVGTDPSYPSHPGGPTLTTNAIRFAADQPGKTGLYVSLSCYYDSAALNTPVTVLDPFGAFTVQALNYDDAHIVATHPVMSDLTDAILSNWGSSMHEGFNNWPDSGPGAFTVLAIGKGAGSYVASDLSAGMPYILARGEGLLPVTNSFFLSPQTASNPTNSTHTVCATVVTNGMLRSGVDVAFNVVSGPNAGVTGNAISGGNGQACFTYLGSGGFGADTIVAQYTNLSDVVVTSQPVTKVWINPCGPSAPTVTATIVCDTNEVEVFFSEMVGDDTATNAANYTADNGINVTNAAFAAGSRSEVILTTDQNFVPNTTYTLTISNVLDLCGRVIQPNPTVLTIACTAPCPDIACPSNITVQCAGPGGTPVHYDIWVNPDCTNTVLTFYPPQDSLFSLGTTTVYCFASVAGGPVTNMCSFPVIVTDEVPPTILCPSNVAVSAACAEVTLPLSVTATDNCCGSVSLVCTPPLNSQFAAGTTTPVHCVATDCSGNSNSCDFTVQVIQVPDAGPPQITACPSNLVVCATNSCGPMPDATSEVLVSDGTETVYVSQSIPPGTILCTNTTVTFTVSNLCGQTASYTAKVTVGPCCCNPLLALQITNITVWEWSGGVSTAYHFPTKPMDPRLLAIPGGPTPVNYDFSTVDGEYYDVYLSGGDGTPNTNGCCLTIVCNQPSARTNYDAGGNIDAVELDAAGGLRLGATLAGSVQLGLGLTDPNLVFTSGMADNALGLSDGLPTYLGCGVSRITLYFVTPCGPVVTPVYTQNGFASSFSVSWKYVVSNPIPILPGFWQVAYATNLIGPWVLTGVSNPPYVVPATNRAMFFRLEGR